MTAGKPKAVLAARIGAIKAKLDAKKTGTWRLVTNWNNRVPIPAVNKATLGSMPVISGMSTSAPKATNSICAPARICLGSGSLSESCMLAILLFGAENSITRIAQSRHNIAIAIQALVDGGGIDFDLRMRLLHGGNALRRSH